jgi:Zn finger protein HypA/HybF involved in hydrogenase expression
MYKREYDTVRIMCVVCGKLGWAIKTKRAKIPISHKHCKGVWRNRGKVQATEPQVQYLPQIRKCPECKKHEDKKILDLRGGLCAMCNDKKKIVKMRVCLMCDKYFMSQGIANRRCPKCEITAGLIKDANKKVHGVRYNTVTSASFYE